MRFEWYFIDVTCENGAHFGSWFHKKSIFSWLVENKCVSLQSKGIDYVYNY